MKRVLLATALSVPILAVSAFAVDCHPKAHGGFAVGLHGGYVTAENRISQTAIPNRANSISFGSRDASGRGGSIGLNLSYGHVFSNKLYAGLVILGDLASIKGSSDVAIDPQNLYRFDVKAKETYGADLKLGGLLDKTLAYITIGVRSTKFESTINPLRFPAANPYTGERKKSRRFTGVAFGAGADMPVSERMTVGIQYTHTEYASKNFDFIESGEVAHRLSTKPRTNAFLLNVKYRVW